MEFNFIKEKGLPPPINQEYILLNDFGGVFVGKFYDAACFWHYGSELGIFYNIEGEDVTKEVIAWMPLPEAPKQTKPHLNR